jgi:hypothetical protein
MARHAVTGRLRPSPQTFSDFVRLVKFNLAPLAPGAATVADVTAISSVSPVSDLLFQIRDLPRNRPCRMESSVVPFADARTASQFPIRTRATT